MRGMKNNLTIRKAIEILHIGKTDPMPVTHWITPTKEYRVKSNFMLTYWLYEAAVTRIGYQSILYSILKLFRYI